jgi:O-antigen/teichoic acid export membrane protein
MAFGMTARFGARGAAGALAAALLGSGALRLVGMALGVLVGVQLARGLGVAGYGLYGIAMSIISVAMIPTEFGLPQLVTREAARADAVGDRSTIATLLRWSLRFTLANTAAVLAVGGLALLVLLPRTDPSLRASLLWGAALLPLVAVGGIYSAALRGTHRVVEGQLAELLIRPGLLSLGLALAWVLLGRDGLSPGFAMALNALTAGVAAVFVFARFRPSLPAAPAGAADPAAARQWMRSAVPLAAGEGMRIFSGNLAILVLGAMAAPADVGLYRVAAGVYTATTLPSALLNVACAPTLARLHAQGNTAALRRLNAWMALFLVAASAGCLLLFALFGASVLPAIFGAGFAASHPVLLVMLVGEVAASLLGHPTVVLNMLDRELAVTRYSAVATGVNIVACVALIGPFGAVGAAWGVAAAQFAWRLLCWNDARRHLALDTSILAWRGGR